MDKSARNLSKSQREAIRDRTRPGPVRLANAHPRLAFIAELAWAQLAAEDTGAVLTATMEDEIRAIRFEVRARLDHDQVWACMKLLPLVELDRHRSDEGAVRACLAHLWHAYRGARASAPG